MCVCVCEPSIQLAYRSHSSESWRPNYNILSQDSRPARMSLGYPSVSECVRSGLGTLSLSANDLSLLTADGFMCVYGIIYFTHGLGGRCRVVF